MLKTRVITALVLVALLLPSLFYLPLTEWALLVAIIIGIAAWEWGAFLGWGGRARIVFGGLVALGLGGFALISPSSVESFGGGASRWVFGIAAIFWSLVIPLWLRQKWALPAIPGLLISAVVLVPTWLAMVQLRAQGTWVLLGVFALVWMADIAAYFAGRAFGKHKLAPSISPGKTWEGAFGAVVGVLVYGFVLRQVTANETIAVGMWFIALLLLTVYSIVGDLFESMLKRQAGIKDSSNILPGHGGVLDRIDSLTSTLPMATFLLLIIS